MKRLYTLFLALAGVFGMTSCDDEFDPVYDPAIVQGNTLEAIDAEYVLAKPNADQPFATFNFNAVDFGINMAVQYTLQAAIAGTNFENPASLGTTHSVDPLDVLTSRINNTIVGFGVAENTAADIEFRIVAEAYGTSSAIAGIAPLYSNVITSKITPYAAKRTFPALCVPGEYQSFWGAPNWNIANYDQALYSKNADGKYEGYIYFPIASEFKIADGSWDDDKNWGSADGTTLVPAGSNLKITEPGCYRINVDLNALTISIVKANWSVIGDAVGGWDASNDINLVYDPDKHVYKAIATMTAGEYKFRANQDWIINLGASTEPNAEATDLSYGGDNMTFEGSGEYTIALNLNSGVYSYKFYKGTFMSDYPAVRVAGDFNGWNEKTTENVLISKKDDGNYNGYIYFGQAGAFKFTNGTWSLSWGLAADGKSLTTDNGGNITNEIGMYYLSMSTETLELTQAKTDWSIIGEAAGGWDAANDIMLTWNETTGALEATANLVNGEWKFRANHDWTYNFGDDQNGGIKAGGDNFKVTEPGSYLIRLYLPANVDKGRYDPAYEMIKQ